MITVRAMTYSEAKKVASSAYKRREFVLSCVFFVADSKLRDWVFKP